MASYVGLGLDAATHDLALDATGNLVMARGNLAVGQHIKQRLLFWLGEWFLDTSAGVPWLQYVFTRPFSQELAEAVIKREVVGTPGVKRLTSFRMEVDLRNRSLSILSMAVVTDEDETVEVSV